jgi:Tol biopolymer transport system component
MERTGGPGPEHVSFLQSEGKGRPMECGSGVTIVALPPARRRRGAPPATSSCVLFGLAAALLTATAFATGGPLTSRLSVDTAGGDANGASDRPSLNTTGRYAVFESAATDLIAVDGNAFTDIFLRDRDTGTTERVSVNTTGGAPNNNSRDPDVSADGRYVAFSTFATNLRPDPMVGGTSILVVRDRQLGVTERISIPTATAETGSSRAPSISDDGNWVAFHSSSSNLVVSDTNSLDDVFLHDRSTDTTTLVSVGAGGQGDGHALPQLQLSGNGNFVAFATNAANHLAGGADSNGVSDIYVRNISGGSTSRVSVANDGSQGNGASTEPSISSNGRYVAFTSAADNLVPGDTNGVADVFVRDTVAGTTVRVSRSTAGLEGDGPSGSPRLSDDGTYVTFVSSATNLVAADNNFADDVFLHHLASGTTTRVSQGVDNAEANGNSGSPTISQDGRYVAFSSDASNLILSDDTNGLRDVFLRDRLASVVAVTTLTGAPLSGTEIQLNWEDNSGLEDGYQIWKYDGASYVLHDVTAPNTTSYVDGGLQEGTRYYYRVRAFRGTLFAPFSNKLSVRTFAPIPEAPSSLMAQGVAQTRIRLNWNDNSAFEDGFRVERKQGSMGTYAEIAVLGPNATTYRDDGLSPNVAYVYRVRAFNDRGNSAYSNERAAATMPLPPPAPTNLAATVISGSQVDLAWTDNSSGAAREDGFRIYRKRDSDPAYVLVHTTARDVNSWSDTGASAGERHIYYVQAFNATAVSRSSNKAIVFPGP